VGPQIVVPADEKAPATERSFLLTSRFQHVVCEDKRDFFIEIL